MGRDRPAQHPWVRFCLGSTLTILAAFAVGPRFDRVHRPLSVPHRERALLPQRRFLPGSRVRTRKELSYAKDRRVQLEFRRPQPAVTCERARNTCVAESKRAMCQWFGPSSRRLVKETDSPVETSSDKTRPLLSECSQPSLPA